MAVKPFDPNSRTPSTSLVVYRTVRVHFCHVPCQQLQKNLSSHTPPERGWRCNERHSPARWILHLFQVSVPPLKSIQTEATVLLQSWKFSRSSSNQLTKNNQRESTVNVPAGLMVWEFNRPLPLFASVSGSVSWVNNREKVINSFQHLVDQIKNASTMNFPGEPQVWPILIRWVRWVCLFCWQAQLGRVVTPHFFDH